jgi:hypothetical protein
MPIAVLLTVLLKFRVVPSSIRLEEGEKYSMKMGK